MHPPKGYKYLSLLGKGQATTWLAETISGVQVVIKTLELKNVANWKGIELFEREVNVLQQMDHPSIPKFIDFIKDEYEGAKRWHIVQEKVDGEKLDPTSSWSEGELRELAKSVLESLAYLQSFSPPLLHRDIKPDNLIRKENGYALTDFGSVRHIIPSDIGGSTIAGTSGYMAPEQLMGRAGTTSDLYGLGMTLIHLISHQHPDNLEVRKMTIQWKEYQKKLSRDFVDFVNTLTEPHTENRFENAGSALDSIRGDKNPPMNLVRRATRTLRVSEKKDSTIVKFRYPREGILGLDERGPFAIVMLFFAFFSPWFVTLETSIIFQIVLTVFFVMIWFRHFYRTPDITFVFSKEGLRLNGTHVDYNWIEPRISNFLKTVADEDSIHIQRTLMKIASTYVEEPEAEEGMF